MIWILFRLTLNLILFIIAILSHVFAVHDKLITISIVDEIKPIVIVISLISLCTFISNYVDLFILIVAIVFLPYFYHVRFRFMY